MTFGRTTFPGSTGCQSTDSGESSPDSLVGRHEVGVEGTALLRPTIGLGEGQVVVVPDHAPGPLPPAVALRPGAGALLRIEDDLPRTDRLRGHLEALVLAKELEGELERQ